MYYSSPIHMTQNDDMGRQKGAYSLSSAIFHAGTLCALTPRFGGVWSALWSRLAQPGRSPTLCKSRFPLNECIAATY